jgi:uncharacterized membrane protein HdeD (DUF308 family)
MATPILVSGFAELRHTWGWLLALGIGMVLLGVVALAVMPAATLGTTIVLAGCWS